MNKRYHSKQADKSEFVGINEKRDKDEDTNQKVIEHYLETKDNLNEFLTAYAQAHPEVDIRTIMPNAENIKKIPDNVE